MIGLERVAWSWVLDHISETGVLPSSPEAQRIDIFKFLITKGFLFFNTDGSLALSLEGVKVYNDLVHRREIVQFGGPIAEKDIVCDPCLITGRDWRKIRINGLNSTYDGSCLLIGVPKFIQQHARKDTAQLALDIRVSSILDDVNGGFAEDAVPVAYQRLSLFEPGLVWFQTEHGLMSIQEIYYDLFSHYLARWANNTSTSVLCQDKNFLLVHYIFTEFKLEHSIVAIIAECIPDDWPELNISSFQEF